MGLAISVGVLAEAIEQGDSDTIAYFEESFENVNRVLKANGLPMHQEPKELPEFLSWSFQTDLPYSYLHHLRRFAAHTTADPDWKPKKFPKKADPAEDPTVADEMAMLSSHLLCHSDCEGFYVPIDFTEPIFCDDEDEIPGAGMLGSSQGLMRELVAVARYLQIGLRKGKLSEAEAERISEIVEEEGDFWIEHLVWLELFEACKYSIEQKTMIVFQ